MLARLPKAPVAELLNPRSVAVIGASEDQTKFGGRLYRMLLKHGYGGTVYPINPARQSLFGLRTCPRIDDTPEPPDMVVMALPRDKVLPCIEAAAQRGARAAIVITAKFSDAGAEGAALESQLVAAARQHGMRLIGPNCLGVISPAHRLVLCSSPALDIETLPAGPIGLISQSGALMATMFDRAATEGVGFSHAVSVGNQADLELADFVDFMIDDPATRVICSYIEGLKNPARFVEVARRARSAGKPWLAVKAGRTEAGSAAAFSHTASLAGSHAVFEAVCRDEGVTLLDDPFAMVTLAAAMARHPGRHVRRVAVVTTSGGGGALAADALSVEGMELARFTAETRGALDALYPPDQAHNPVDLGARKFDEAVDVGQQTLRIVANDAHTDALLVPLTTAPMLEQLAEQVALGLLDEQGQERRPAFIVLQPGRAADGARAVLRRQGLAYIDHAGQAVQALAAWSRHSRQRAIDPAGVLSSVVPTLDGLTDHAPTSAAGLPAGDMDEMATKRLLASFGVPVNRGALAQTAQEAVHCAHALGFPVVMKVVSPEVVHKSDVGGVALDIGDVSAAQRAFGEIVDRVNHAQPGARITGVLVQQQVPARLELIVGARRDPQFGPVVVVGAGGTWVELLPRQYLARAPLTPPDALRALQSLPVWPVLQGYRGPRLAVEAVVEAIVRLSWVAAALGERDFEFDANPLRVHEAGCCVVDARLRLG